MVAWFGNLAAILVYDLRPSYRHDLIEDPPFIRSQRDGAGDEDMPFAPNWGRYLFESDSAIIAAGLTSCLAQQLELATLAPVWSISRETNN